MKLLESIPVAISFFVVLYCAGVIILVFKMSKK